MANSHEDSHIERRQDDASLCCAIGFRNGVWQPAIQLTYRSARRTARPVGGLLKVLNSCHQGSEGLGRSTGWR
jgi:hypothetical protein